MKRRSFHIWFEILPAAYLVLALLYVAWIVRPGFYFHHQQSPFLATGEFLEHYLVYPGGASEWLASLLMQSFYSQILGPVLFLGMAVAVAWAALGLMDTVRRDPVHRIWALFPLSLVLLLANNYNLPYSIIVSVLAVLLLLLWLAKKGKGLLRAWLIITFSAPFLYYFSGSGYLALYSVTALLLILRLKWWSSLPLAGWMAAITLLLPRLAADSLIPLPPEETGFRFFSPEVWFRSYEPPAAFYALLLSLPLLSALSLAGKFFRMKQAALVPAISWTLLLVAAVSGHFNTFRSDARRIVASDYFCYHGNAQKTARAATGLEEYSFAANLNYNLAISKAGRLTEDFFNFLQIEGSDALHPDVEFSSELSFVAADFYYHLGFISEARHWAYESLVFYPQSVRAHRLLVKVHLVTGEYDAAERSLHILKKGVINRKFVKEFSPYINDTVSIVNAGEIMEKRSFMPAEKELSPFIDQRFRELLQANDNNRAAYEFLVLYTLLEAQLDQFMELYREAGKYFENPVTVYEEAILMYGKRNRIPVEQEYEISPATLERFHTFSSLQQQYGGTGRKARSALYWEMGQSYFYFLEFVFPRIIKPEIIYPEYEEPQI